MKDYDQLLGELFNPIYLINKPPNSKDIHGGIIESFEDCTNALINRQKTTG